MSLHSDRAPSRDCLDETDLLELAEGVGSAEQRAEAEHHLRGCEDCRESYTTLLNWDDPSAGRAPSILPEPGEVVGRYVIERLVGVGGAGAVYAAEDPLLKRRVALKMLHRHGTTGAGDIGAAQLAREAQTLARLSHPNILGVHDVGEWRAQLFIAMEWVDGGDLAAWLSKSPRSSSEILRVFRQAGEGLSAAHAAGLVHCDFKPQNVLLGTDGRARVTDFGFHDGQVRIGTPAYMAPEQLERRGCDARADQFAFCVALYEALTGARPSVGRGSPAAPGVLPKGVAKALLRGLSHEPKQRFASMEALLSKLQPPAAKGTPLALAAAGVVAATLAAVGVHRERSIRACRREDAPMRTTWTPAAQQTLEQAFLRTGLPFAQDLWERTRPLLEDYVQAWSAARVDSCLAERVRGEEPAQVRALQDRCLDERRGDFVALLELLKQGQSSVVRNAPHAVRMLEPTTSCSRSAVLAVHPPSFGKDEAEHAQRAGVQLQSGRALWGTYQLQEAHAAAERAVTEAQGTGSGELLAEALALQGSLEAGLAASTATETLQRALWQAQTSRADRWALQAALALAKHLYYDDTPAADIWTRYAESLSLRMPETLRNDFELELQRARMSRMRNALPEAEAHLESARAFIVRGQTSSPLQELKLEELASAIYKHFGQDARALKARQNALRWTASVYGPRHYETARATLELAKEYPFDPDKKQALVQQGLPTVVQTLGEKSKLVGIAYDRLAQAKTYAGRFDEALLDSEKAVEILREVASRDAAYAFAVGNQGDIYLGLGDTPKALERYTFELTRRTTLFGEDSNLVHPLERIGEAQLATGRMHEALTTFRRAAGLWAAGPRGKKLSVQALLDFGLARAGDATPHLLERALEEAERSGDAQLVRRIRAWPAKLGAPARTRTPREASTFEKP